MPHRAANCLPFPVRHLSRKALIRLPAYATLLLLGALVYSSSFAAPFYLDDEVTIQDNNSIRHPFRIIEALNPPSHVFSAGRPILNLSFALNYWAHGQAVEGYHFLNLAIHFCAAIVLFELLLRLGELLDVRANYSGKREVIAFTAAATWFLLPIQTASVTYVSQRAESLMGLCYLLTVFCFLKATSEIRSAAWHVGAIASFIIGAGVKENIVTAPFFCLLLDRAVLSGSLAIAWRRNRTTYAAFALVLGAFLILSLLGGLTERMGFSSHSHDYLRHLWIQVRAVGHYLRLVCWPSPLIFDYGIDLDVLERYSLPFGLAATIALVLGTVLAYVRSPVTSLLGAWFLLTLAPTTSFLPVYGAPIAENRVYLPSISVAVSVTLLVAALLHRKALVPLACALFALGVITYGRNRDYMDQVGLWNDTVAKSPGNHRALGWSGIALLATPDGVAEGIKRLESARQIRPDSADTNCNLGRAYSQLGDFRRAIHFYRETLVLRPNDAFALIGMSVAIRQSGEPISQAISFARAAVQCRPDRADFSSVLGALLLDSGLAAESIMELERAVRLDPRFAQAQLNLGNAYMATPGRIDDAVASYRTALTLSPKSFAILYNLGNALVRQGTRLHEAERCYEQASELNPEFQPAREKLLALRTRLNPQASAQPAPHQ